MKRNTIVAFERLAIALAIISSPVLLQRIADTTVTKSIGT